MFYIMKAIMYNRGTSPFEEKFFISIKSSTMKTFSLCLFLLTLSFNVFSQEPCSQDTSELNTFLYYNVESDGNDLIYTSVDTIGDTVVNVIASLSGGVGNGIPFGRDDQAGFEFNDGTDSGDIASVSYSFIDSVTGDPLDLATFFTFEIPEGGGIQVNGVDIVSYSLFGSSVLTHDPSGGIITILNDTCQTGCNGNAATVTLHTEEVSSIEITFINGSTEEPNTYYLNSSTIPQGEASCFDAQGEALAINFLEFLASVNDESSVDLSWTAVDEGQGVYDIEFSANGYDYSVLDQVTAINTNSRSAASSYDKTVAWPEGTNAGYFRLKHTDLDGEITYTKSIQLSLSEALTDISAYPVPTHGILNIKADKAAKLQESIKIYDMLGSLVYEEENDSNANINTSIDISSLISGVYILKIGEYTQRIQKL